MQKYLLTNPRYSGSVDVTYNADGLLDIIDFSNSNLRGTPDLLAVLKNQIPHEEINFKGSFSKETMIVVVTREVEFQEFWDKYANKVNRHRAEKLFKSLSKADRVLAYCEIARYDRYLAITGYRSKADPDTYLRNKYWQNEYK